MVIPIGTGMVRAAAGIEVRGFFSMPEPHVWNRTENEMELVTLGADAKFNYNFHFRFSVAFNDIQVVDGQPVLGVLDELCGKVESIFLCIEAECRRLGIIK
jgi:hypothetical protein